jgi:hypothetical protein
VIHFNATKHPTAAWTLQQLREALPGDREYKFLLHDRHKSFSIALDGEVANWGIEVLKSPARTPTANAFCERLIGTIRRECLDYVIPLSESHLKRTLREWMEHYNTGRPHQSLGPGIPDQAKQKLPTNDERAGSAKRHARRKWRRCQPVPQAIRGLLSRTSRAASS